MNVSKQFLIKPGSKVSLAALDPDFTDSDESKQSALKKLESNHQRIRKLQEVLYAEHQRGLLICLQAIDTGGKDGIIRHVFSSMNPQGCRVSSFKPPAGPELDHDFLWRAHRDAPGKGEVVIFNRSHYEDVLVARIQNLVPKSVWSKRYDEINVFEKFLSDNGTHILKFFLHISKDEQLSRFKDRLDDPEKRWKVSAADYADRARWDDYQNAFDDMLSKCSTDHAPWHVIPANHKWYRDLVVSQITADYLEGLGMSYPAPAVDFDELMKKYHAAEKQS